MVGEVLGDGEGGHGVDLLFAHDAHGLRAELVGVIDGGDTGQDRVKSSGFAGAMNAHTLAHTRRFLDGGLKLGLGVLVGRGEFAIGQAVAAGLINLDEVRALLELLPYHGDEFAGIVSVGGIGGDVLGGIEVDCVFMASENADGVAADAHARARNQSGVDGIAYGGVRRSRALGSHVALGGEARHQILAGRDFREDRALGYGFDDGLEVLGSRMEEKMDVDVDEPGHQSCRAQIDHRGAAGMGDQGTSFNNAIAAHEHLARADEGAMLHIEDVGGMENDGTASGNVGGSGGRLSLECIYSGESQDEDERSGGGAQGSEHAPNTSTLAVSPSSLKVQRSKRELRTMSM